MHNVVRSETVFDSGISHHEKRKINKTLCICICLSYDENFSYIKYVDLV